MTGIGSPPDVPTSGSIRATRAALLRVQEVAEMFGAHLNRSSIEVGVQQGAAEMTPAIVDAAIDRAIELTKEQIGALDAVNA